MIKFLGKSLLELQIDNLRSCNIDDITVVTGYCDHMINFQNVNYVKNEHFESTNMNESLFCAKEKLGDSIVSYSDIIFEKKVIRQMLDCKCDIGIAVNLNWKPLYKGRTSHPHSEAENVLLEHEKILEIRKNIVKNNQEQTIAEFMGLIKFSKKGAETFLNKFFQLKKNHQGKFHSASTFEQAYLTDMLQELIDSNKNVEPIFIDGKWCEIDTTEDLTRAADIF